MKEPWELGKPSRIFVCSISDLFGSWIPAAWRDQVLEAIENCPVEHTFILLTKAPENIPLSYEFPENVWVGATVTSYNDVSKIHDLRLVRAEVRFLCFEPLLGPIVLPFHSEHPGLDLLWGIQWIIIGKLTGSRKVRLQNSWVIDLLEEARFWRIPVFLKDNLGWRDQRREWPE